MNHAYQFIEQQVSNPEPSKASKAYQRPLPGQLYSDIIEPAYNKGQTRFFFIPPSLTDCGLPVRKVGVKPQNEPEVKVPFAEMGTKRNGVESVQTYSIDAVPALLYQYGTFTNLSCGFMLRNAGAIRALDNMTDALNCTPSDLHPKHIFGPNQELRGKIEVVAHLGTIPLAGRYGHTFDPRFLNVQFVDMLFRFWIEEVGITSFSLDSHSVWGDVMGYRAAMPALNYLCELQEKHNVKIYCESLPSSNSDIAYACNHRAYVHHRAADSRFAKPEIYGTIEDWNEVLVFCHAGGSADQMAAKAKDYMARGASVVLSGGGSARQEVLEWARNRTETTQ